MTQWRVAFPMYVLPQMQADMRSLWIMVKTRLTMDGVENLPDEPEFSDPLAQGHVPQDLLMLQYCGYPYVTQWQESKQLTPFACLHYDAPHCEGKLHRSVIVVAEQSKIKKLSKLKNSRVAINGYDSNTGMNLLRHTIAPIAKSTQFFSQVTVTGAHAASAQAVADGSADVAAIDCVTFAYLSDYDAALTAQLRVIATTETSPALPLFVASHVPQDIQQKLYTAWQEVMDNRNQYAATLKRLRMQGIEPITNADLDVIAKYEAQAAQMGYPELI
ncbi:MAG: PhnD/SsuA/transferrin family substrate-binding protein [Alphaproteobacteria bacterium]|nr:PhnD/SsuA/transferrin family substrate-binding protein [Alphaproteobacteria bacterium]